MKVTPEAAALLYTNVWYKHDRRTVENLKDGKSFAGRIKALDEALVTYVVARNIPGRGKVRLRRLPTVLKALSAVPCPRNEKAAIAAVTTLTKVLRKMIIGWKGKKMNPHSLASKLLWQRFPSKIVIVDGNAKVALGAKGEDYRHFFAKWKLRYRKERPKITAACKKLRLGLKWSENYHSLKRANIPSNKEWFRRRVFDQMLWKEGGRSRPVNA